MKEQDHVHLTMIQGYKAQLVYPSDILNNIFNEATLYGIYCSHKRLLRKFQCICITYCKPTLFATLFHDLLEKNWFPVIYFCD